MRDAARDASKTTEPATSIGSPMRCKRDLARELESGEVGHRNQTRTTKNMSQQYENVTLEQSKNVPLTGSDWTGAGRTAIDEPSREGPVGDIAQGEEEGHHASGSSGRVGRERAACEAAVEGAEEMR